MKHKVLISSHNPLYFSGFANLARNIGEVLANQGGYEVAFVDIMNLQIAEEKLKTCDFKIYNEGSEYRNRGKKAVEFALTDFKPNIVLTIGDPWDSYYIPDMKKKYSFYWICYSPIETIPIEPRVNVEVVDDLRKGLFNFVKYYEQADKIIAYNEFGKQAIDKLLEGKKEVSYIYHGYDDTIFDIKETVREDVFGKVIDKDSFVGLTVARNNYRKSLDLIMIGWKKFIDMLTPEERPTAHLYLHVPKEQTGWDLDRLAITIGLEGNILVNRTIDLFNPMPEDKLADIMCSSDVYINGSRGEGFGLPIIESMGCGVQNLVVDYAGPACIAEEISNPRFIDTISVSEFMIDSKALSKHAIINTDHLAQQLLESFRNRLTQEEKKEISNRTRNIYSWNVIGQQWIDTLKSIKSSLLENSRFTFTRI